MAERPPSPQSSSLWSEMNPFKTLGVSVNSSIQAIKAAFQVEIKKNSPGQKDGKRRAGQTHHQGLSSHSPCG